MSANQPQIEAGQTATYTVVITNTTGEAVDGMLLSSTLPPSSTFVSEPGSPIVFDPVSRTVTWEAGTVPPGTGLTTTYQVQAAATAADTLLLAEVVWHYPVLVDKNPIESTTP